MEDDGAFADFIDNPKSEVKGNRFIDDYDGAAKDMGCAALESYAMTPQASFLLTATWPAQRVPWWSRAPVGFGRGT